MPVYCRVTLKPGATPEQLAALGAALWRWCARAAGAGGVYQYLDNQALTDLMDGRLPAADRAGPPGTRWVVRFGIGDGAFPDDEALLDSLRREIPGEGVVDIMAGGTSWAASGPQGVIAPDGADVAAPGNRAESSQLYRLDYCLACGKSHTLRDASPGQHLAGADFSYTCPETGRGALFRPGTARPFSAPAPPDAVPLRRVGTHAPASPLAGVP